MSDQNHNNMHQIPSAYTSSRASNHNNGRYSPYSRESSAVPSIDLPPAVELPSGFKTEDKDLCEKFKKFVVEGLKQNGNNWAKSWYKKYPFLAMKLREKVDIFGNAETENNEAPDEWKSTIGEYVCKECYLYVESMGEENCQGLGLKEDGYHKVRNVKTQKIQSKSVDEHIKSKLHKAATGGSQQLADKVVWTAVYFSAMLNIPFVTHPFICYLINFGGGDCGDKMHGVTTAAKVTVVLGSLIRS